MKQTLLALLSFILLSNPIAVTAQQSGDFTYTDNNGAIAITGYTGAGGAVTIPSTINDIPVTSIGTEAFYDFTSSDWRHDPQQRHQHRGRGVRLLHRAVQRHDPRRCH